MNSYIELEHRADEIHNMLAKDLVFDRDKRGIVIDISLLGEKMRTASSCLNGNPKKFIQLMAAVIDEASKDKGFSQIRSIKNDHLGKRTISLRGGFPSTPNSSVPFERAQHIMSQRCGVDVTVKNDKLFVESVLGLFGQSDFQDINPTGDITWGKSAQKDSNERLSEEEIRNLTNELTELVKLTIAHTLINLVHDEVLRVKNS